MQQARDEEARNFHIESALSGDVVPEIAAEEQVHDQVKIHRVLECIVHIDYELAIDLGDQFELVHDARYAFLGDNPRFRHLFHGVLLRLCFLRLDAPDFPEAAATYGVDLDEVGLADALSCVFVLRGLEVAGAHLMSVSLEQTIFVFYK